MFTLLREDVGRLEEKGRLVISSSAHQMVHTLEADARQVDALVETFYIWLSPIAFTAAIEGTGNNSKVPTGSKRGADKSTNQGGGGGKAGDDADALRVQAILRPQRTYECAGRKDQAVNFFVSGAQNRWRSQSQLVLLPFHCKCLLLYAV